MERIEYTEQQTAAIEDRGGALLVSAAAGSGKTKVLVERLMRRVAAGADICDFLIITYTRAAAAELRSKILSDIGLRSGENLEDRHLRRQAAMIYQTDIGTIHGFCGKIVRENAHLLDIDPDFRVADETESDLLRRRTLEDVLNDRYDRLTAFEGFTFLADTVSTGRDDTNLAETVLDTHAKLMSHPYPERWAAQQLSETVLADCADAAETIWGRYLMRRVGVTADYWISELAGAVGEIQGDKKMWQGYGESLGVMLDWLCQFRKALDAGWDEAHSCGAMPCPNARGRVSGFERIKDLRRRCRSEMDKAAAMFALPSDKILADLQRTYPAVKALILLVLDFDRAYKKEKESRRVLDFSDLEHMAVRLLFDSESGEDTETAKELSRQYAEVMVDEFQDVNRMQDMIFRAVSGGGRNLFMVGDVKQSIYRFRLAEPEIFLEYYRRFADAGTAEEGAPRKVNLSKNFRSRADILEAVNFLFAHLMSEDFGEMNYTEREYLYPGREFPPAENPAVELDIIDLAGCPKEGDAVKREVEPAFVAGRVKRLIEREGYRCDDIVILMRSTKNKAALYERALKAAGIPAAADKGEDFFSQTEVTVMLSLLDIIDNPVQDVPLIAVLRSPLYGFTPDKLADIRDADREGSFFSALEKQAEVDDHCRRFLEELAHFRLSAPGFTADQFIWHVLVRTNALQIFGAMDRGEQRRDNLIRLFEHARRYEENGYRGVFGFVAMIHRVAQRGDGGGGQSGAGKVRIMSIHKSKGLEFPVVFLVDLGKGFNLQDTKKNILVHPKMGIGIQIRDRTRKIHYPTLAKMAIAGKIREETLAEELRVLYVGLTRPQEKLVLVCGLENAEKKLLAHSANAGASIPPHMLDTASSMADWILPAALMRPECGCLLSGDAPCDVGGTAPPWDANLISWKKVMTEEASRVSAAGAAEAGREAQTADHDPSDVAVIAKRLAFRYPHEGALPLPSKLTATELKGRAADAEAMEEAGIFDGMAAGVIFERPAFVKKTKRLTGAERGTATHLVMQYIDVKRCGDLPGIQAELVRLEDQRLITAAEAAAVRPESIARFFASEAGQAMMTADSLVREFKFSILIPGDRYCAGAGEERVLLQGVIDCYFESGDKLTIIDFKTDYVDEKTASNRALYYKGQIDAYAYALRRIYGKPVGRKILYFFAVDRAVEM